ncbi:uncharacterized protein CTRU02_208490 [Colletotrichum truncatum]|uniref:Uncharacterized protein n=1 Tax=Colletotrichum truncatum TaxID=5467 RepID=A0ACC3YWI6_COLTU|nr:uncharacterized protein CTRU02_10244 [Colletotrichum truncatum]KAF6787448.1 hypothetical protein CTRU02_10244 [Colletotrichum truncatum]
MGPSGVSRWPSMRPKHKIARKPVPDRTSTQSTLLDVQTPAAGKKRAERVGVSERDGTSEDDDSTRRQKDSPLLITRENTLFINAKRGADNEKAEEMPSWRPQWLRPRTLACFAGLALCAAIALPTMLWYSQRNDGLIKTKEDFGYVWRFGPTAVLTIVAAFWARVELQALRYMPWIDLRRTQTPDYDLDYTSMLSPFVLYQSLRRKHWLVLLVSVTSILIRAEIVLAPGLFRLTPIRLVKPVSIQTGDSFELMWETKFLNRESTIAYYAARAIHDFNMTYPFGVTAEAAYQTFTLAENGVRGTVGAPLTVQVDGFLSDMKCLKLESWEVTHMGNYNNYTRFFQADINLQFEGCQQNVSIHHREIQLPSQLAPLQYVDFWSINDTLRPTTQPCPNLPKQYNQFVYFGGRYEKNGVNGTTMQLKTADAVLCSPTAWISKVEVVDDGISPNVTVLPNQPSTPIELDIWDILSDAIPGSRWRTSGTGSRPGYGPVTGERLFSGDQTNFSDTTEQMYNSTIALSKRLMPLIGHYILRQGKGAAGTGEMSVTIDKLALNQQVCLSMFAVFLLLTAIVGISLVWSRRHTTIWHRDPATILGNLLFLKDYPELRDQALDGDSENKKRLWSHGTFSPLVLRPWVQIIFTIFVCGLLIGLGTTLQSSRLNHGLATVNEEGYYYLLWTSLPSLIMLGVSLYTSSCDFVLRGLSTLYSLSVKPCNSRQQLDFSMLDMLGLRALLKSFQQRLWTVTLSQVMVLFCGLLATLATLLFSVETVPKPMKVQLQQTSWLGNQRISNNDTSTLTSNRERVQSLLARRHEANFTYPRNTYADMVFPSFDASNLSSTASIEQTVLEVKMPAAKLVSSCEMLPGDGFNVTLHNYTEMETQNTTVTVYQGPFLYKAKCPNGKSMLFGRQFVVGKNFSDSNSDVSQFAAILDSPGNLYHTNIGCGLNITDNNDLLSASMQQTYVWGQWNHKKSDFDLLRYWRCNYSWAQFMVNVTMIRSSDGLYNIDTNKPPVPDFSNPEPMDPPFAVPVYDADLLSRQNGPSPGIGTAMPTIDISERTAGDVNGFFRPIIQPYGNVPLTALGDPDWDDRILQELHANLGFSSAQLANLENRLGVGQNSSTAPFPSEGLSAMDALVLDTGRRRLIQNATATYVIIGILGLVALVNLWTLLSGAMRHFGIHSGWLSMDVKGLAPDGYGSIGLMTSLLHDSNAVKHIPSGSDSLSTLDLHDFLEDMLFRLGWFRREVDQSMHFTVGVLEDTTYPWVESKKEREAAEKSMYKVVNTSEETAYQGGGPDIIDRSRNGGWI